MEIKREIHESCTSKGLLTFKAFKREIEQVVPAKPKKFRFQALGRTAANVAPLERPVNFSQLTEWSSL